MKTNSKYLMIVLLATLSAPAFAGDLIKIGECKKGRTSHVIFSIVDDVKAKYVLPVLECSWGRLRWSERTYEGHWDGFEATSASEAIQDCKAGRALLQQEVVDISQTACSQK